jgi:hypothetical protein
VNPFVLLRADRCVVARRTEEGRVWIAAMRRRRRKSLDRSHAPQKKEESGSQPCAATRQMRVSRNTAAGQ